MPFSRVQVFAAILMVFVATGCGKPKSDSFDGIACGQTDQHRSYMNPMDSTQVQTIAIDSKFDSVQVNKIQNAIRTWNAFGRRTVGHDLFRAQEIALAANSVPVPSEDCNFPGAQNSFSIVRVDEAATWSSLGFTKDNPGVTLRCSGGRDFASKQVVLINPSNMAADSLFESVVVHELGHSIGLDHSCLTKGAQDGYASCSGLGASHAYVEAVMYPYVSVNHLKEDLRANDEERASCALNYRP